MGCRLVRVYYLLKPFIPVRTRVALRRRAARKLREQTKSIWPIDSRCAVRPAAWKGWPDGKKFAFVLTHDVEAQRGLDRLQDLLSMERRVGFRSSVNFVPLRYSVPAELRKSMAADGFEVGIHGLRHDGKLYSSRERFKCSAIQINRLLAEWSVSGFRSPMMQHNLEWLHDLNIEYDASTFDTDPFEPQPDGLGTIFPQWIQGREPDTGYVELPYTLPQDFTLFVILQEDTIRIWREKLDWIAECGGMALLNTHPDYMKAGDTDRPRYEYPRELYGEFLRYAKEKYRDEMWHVLPRELAAYWRQWAGKPRSRCPA